jgi:site-specific DNA-methyltransferase (adenine-specific)
LWWYYKGLIKKNGAIALNASQPFGGYLMESNRKWFKYEWIWCKNRGSNFATVKYQPFKEHESILIFCEGSTATYNPQLIEIAESSLQRDKVGSIRNRSGGKTPAQLEGLERQDRYLVQTGLRNPSSVLNFDIPMGSESVEHPTQKPLEMAQYFLRTFSDSGNLILDNTAGSGTTAASAIKEGRRCILIEQSLDYCKIAKERIIEALMERGESGAVDEVEDSGKSYQIGFKL